MNSSSGKRSVRFAVAFAAGLGLAGGAVGCSGRQQTEEVVVEVEPEIEDIPGVDPRAVAAFNDGIGAMNETPPAYEDARSAFEQAVQYDANFWEAWENVGLIQMDLGRYEQAVEAFQQERAILADLAARGWPVEARPELALNIGKALALAGRTDEAAEAFGSLLAEDPENLEARANLAALYVQSGRYDQARAFVGELLEMSQNDIGALNALALIYKMEGDSQMASYLWEKCVGEITRVQEGMRDEAQYEGMAPDEADRLRAYNTHRLNRLTRQLSDVQNELGIVAYGGGSFDQAESLFRRSVENNPYNHAARTNLGTIYLSFANFEGAQTQFGEALALRPRDEEALMGMAAALYGLGETEGAVEQYEQLMEEFPENAHGAQRLGDILFQDLNEQQDALRWYRLNLAIRGVNENTCDRATDRVCATVLSIQSMSQGTQPQNP